MIERRPRHYKPIHLPSRTFLQKLITNPSTFPRVRTQAASDEPSPVATSACTPSASTKIFSLIDTMGKSNLSVKSRAFQRQIEFYMTDQSRVEKNKITYLDQLDDEDGVSLVDAQYENIRSCLEQLAHGTTVKLRVPTLIRGGKGVGKFSYIQKRNNTSLEFEDTTDMVRGRKGSHQKKENASYATRVQAHKGAAKCTNTSKKDNTIFALTVNDRCSPQEMEHTTFEFFKHLVEGLDSKRKSIREKAFLLLIDILERSVIPRFLETTSITIFYGCLKSFTMGSAHESYLASRVIGLLAITIGSVSSSREMMQESISIFTLAWNLNSESLKLSVLDCLAITTFFGANDVEEVEKSMSIMWAIFSPKPLSDSETFNKPTAAVLAKAISAWSFLLTTIDPWRISLQIWKESFSFFFTLLECDDCWVSIAVAEAIAAIFETGRVDKFTRKGGINIIEINRKISELVNKTEAPRIDLDNMRETLKTILEFFETECYEELINIPNKREPLELSTVAQSLQLKYFKRFLGWEGFVKHIQHNKVLHEIFDYEEGKRETAFFNEKVQRTLPTLKAHKERTQLRTEHRKRAEDMDYGFGHFDIACQD